MKFLGIIIGAIVLLIGSVLIWKFHTPDYPFLHGLGEALIIAGILAIAVDPWLKEHFYKETLKDSFQHIFGYGLPEFYRERLRAFVNDPVWYRTDMVMECRFQEEHDGKRQIEIHLSWDLENRTPKPVMYHQHGDFEAAEQPNLESVSLTVDESKVDGYAADVKLCPLTDGSLEYRHSGFKIQPQSKGVKYRFTADCSVIYPATFFYAQHFSDPTHHFTLKVRKPPKLKVTPRPGGEFEHKDGWDCWDYDKLFLKDDHIFIRWESEPTKPVNPTAA
jgi:hypothetical protein